MAIKQLGVAPTNPQDAVTKSYMDIGISAENARATAAETVICTSTTRPGSPFEGQAIFETDTNKVLYWQSAGTGWTQPWNQPWGFIGYAQISVQQTVPAVTVTDLTSLSIAWTAVAHRRYRTTVYLPDVEPSLATTFITLVIASSTGTVINESFVTNPTIGAITLMSTAVDNSVAAGAVTRKAQMVCSQGTVKVAYSGSLPTYIIVEDIGPNGVPA